MEDCDSPEFLYAFQEVQRRTPLLFISGKAGTGKSTFIRRLKEDLDRRVAVVAPTGLAALEVGGQTIHSFFKIAPKSNSPDDFRPLRDPTTLRALDILVIDEVSMVRADLLDAVDSVLRVNRQRPLHQFGGVQVVLIGDLFQLPPVVSEDSEREMIAARYGSEFFFAADCIQQAECKFIEFTEVYRQRDVHFIELLQNVREGVDVENTLELLNLKCVRAVREDESPTVLTFTNRQADRINATKLAALPAASEVYFGRIEGNFTKLGRNNDLKVDTRLPAPLELELKVDARVLFVANDRENRWVNGSVGTVCSMEKDRVIVEIDGLGRRKLVEVEPYEWINYEQTFNPETKQIEAEAVGSYFQLPIRPAWAVTVHKSQGMTLDCVRVEAWQRAFASGQLYVALSRCRTWEGISFSRPLTEADLIVNDTVREFYNNQRTERQRGNDSAGNTGSKV